MNTTTLLITGIIIIALCGTCYLLGEIWEDAPSAVPNIVTTPYHANDSVSITEVVVLDKNDNIRSIHILDERTGKYHNYTSKNLTLCQKCNCP